LFFSSRRRHTRFSRDWSSDVCSSDLCDALDGSGSATAPGKSPLTTSCSVDSCLGLVLLAKATSSHVSVLSLQKAIAFSVSTTVVVNKTVAGWNIAWNFTKSKALAALNKVIAVGFDLFDVGTVKLDQVQLMDQQARQLSDLVYGDIYGLTDDDLKGIFGVDENGNPNATIIERTDTPTGFEAISVKNKVTNEVIIAFRGSDTEDGFIDWWGQNLSIWQQFKGPQIDEADQFIERVINSDEAKGSTKIGRAHV